MTLVGALALPSVKVLVVEDDPKVARFVVRVLSEEGFTVDLCRTGLDGVAQARTGLYDLLVLDWMLPDIDGLAVCRDVRVAGVTAPILMLTARGETKDKVHALDLGVDDYLTKPFELEELLARLRALARRGASVLSLDAGPIHIDVAKRYAFVRGRLLDLTARELDLLAYLVKRAGTTVPKAEIAESLWEAGEAMWNVVEVNVSRLRDKLDADASLLETIRGQGYRLSRDADESRPPPGVRT